MCHVLSHLTKLNIIISFYNILMHFEIVFFHCGCLCCICRRAPLLHGPGDDVENEFSYFLIAGKKKENASFIFLLCVCAAARQWDETRRLHFIHCHSLLPWRHRIAVKEKEYPVPCTGRNCRPCPKATSHPFGLAKILFVCCASHLVLVSRFC